MKRIATALLVATLATAGTAALADESRSFESEFPGMVTYTDLHKNDVVSGASSAYPSSANETTSLAGELSATVTYADLQKNDAVQIASSPSFPSSANET